MTGIDEAQFDDRRSPRDLTHRDRLAVVFGMLFSAPVDATCTAGHLASDLKDMLGKFIRSMKLPQRLDQSWNG